MEGPTTWTNRDFEGGLTRAAVRASIIKGGSARMEGPARASIIKGGRGRARMEGHATRTNRNFKGGLARDAARGPATRPTRVFKGGLAGVTARATIVIKGGGTTTRNTRDFKGGLPRVPARASIVIKGGSTRMEGPTRASVIKGGSSRMERPATRTTRDFEGDLNLRMEGPTTRTTRDFIREKTPLGDLSTITTSSVPPLAQGGDLVGARGHCRLQAVLSLFDSVVVRFCLRLILSSIASSFKRRAGIILASSFGSFGDLS
jgi:hypothetical protein